MRQSSSPGLARPGKRKGNGDTEGGDSVSRVLSLAHLQRGGKDGAARDGTNNQAGRFLAVLNLFFSKRDMTGNIPIRNTRLWPHRGLMKPGIIVIQNYPLVITLSTLGKVVVSKFSAYL